jgi:hypothetical protein
MDCHFAHRFAAVLVILMPAVAATAQAPTTKPATPIVMKRHVLVDKGMGDMKSHTILAPDGWKVEGGASWPPPDQFKVLPSQNVKVIAPDGRMVHIGPSIGAVDFRPSPYAQQQLGVQRPPELTASNGNLVLYLPDSLEAWKTFALEKAFKRSFPKATNMRVDKVVVIPELTAIFKRQLEPLQQMAAQNDRQAQALGMRQKSFSDCQFLAATCFYEDEGKKWEHVLVFGTAHFGSDSDIGRQVYWSIEPSVSYRAEAGQLEANMPLLLSIANSLQPTAEWAKMKLDHSAKMNQIAAKGAADRAKIIADSNREISKMIVDGYNARSESQDRTHASFIKAIREVEDYTVPGSDTKVQLPHYYDHVYTNGNGDYILTNDSNFNPNVDPAFKDKRWDTMEPVKN